jgi:GAF domain-containing protein
MSLAYLGEGFTLTLVATSTEIAILDAMQYLDGGPCVDAVAGEQVIEVADVDAMDESAWRLFSRATAATGIKSTLTLPIVAEGTVTGSVNLYAASGRAFTGHHQQIAEIFGAWAPGAVTNNDLSFTTRTTAQQAPQILRERMTLDTALGYLMASQGLSPDEARRQLEEAAARAGVTVSDLAKAIVATQRRQDSD